jgi:two-component system, OmpR family, KDP operon response regulator KdpE
VYRTNEFQESLSKDHPCARRPAPHILLVEDDPSNLYMLQAAIEFEGFTTSQAESAAEALRKIESDPIDVVLLDLGLPDLAGSHLIERIRALSDVPLIVVSGRADEASKIAALDAGADDFVQKPFMHGELLARVRAILRRYDRTRNARAPEEPDCPVPALREQRKNRASPMRDRLLDLLRSREGEIVPVPEIVAELWGTGGSAKERNLRVLVATVRTQLLAEQLPFEIINVHGRGYRLVPKGGHHARSTTALRGDHRGLLRFVG